jgi:hypothetical protein
MAHNWQMQVVHAAGHEKESKLAAVVLIVMGLFFTPFMIGIPLLLIGIYRLGTSSRAARSEISPRR